MVLVLKDPCVKPALECQSLTPQSHLLGYNQVNPKYPTALGIVAQSTPLCWLAWIHASACWLSFAPG